jgi:hypothetical protein
VWPCLDFLKRPMIYTFQCKNRCYTLLTHYSHDKIKGSALVTKSLPFDCWCDGEPSRTQTRHSWLKEPGHSVYALS